MVANEIEQQYPRTQQPPLGGLDLDRIPFKRPFKASVGPSKPAPAPTTEGGHETTDVTLAVTFDIETPSRAWTTRFDTSATALLVANNGLPLDTTDLVSQLPRTSLGAVLGRIESHMPGGPLAVTYVAASGRSIDVTSQQHLDAVVAAELVGTVGKSVLLTPGHPVVLAVTVHLVVVETKATGGDGMRSDSALDLPPQVATLTRPGVAVDADLPPQMAPGVDANLPPQMATMVDMDLPPQMATLVRRPIDGSAAMHLPPQLSGNGYADGTAPLFPAPAQVPSSTGGSTYLADKPGKPTPAQLMRAPTPEEASKAFDFAALDTWLTWHIDYGVQLHYTHEIVDWACADATRFSVAQWWWDAYTKHGIEFRFSTWAADNASAGGHLGPLKWLWSIHQHHGMPFKYTEYALTAASGGGFVDILSWFGQAHTAHGLELKYAAAAIDDASAAGFIPVLEWWLSAASRYRLELRYSADAVNAAARARRWDVLAWWRRAAESNPSIITLKYDPAALSAPARTALGLPMLTSGTSSTPTLPTRSPTLMSRPTLSGFGSADYPTPLPQSLPLEPQTPIAAGPPQPLRAASSSSTYPGLMSPPPYASFSSSTPAASLAPTSGYPGHHRPVSVPATPMETSTSAYLLTPVVMVEPEPEVPVRQLNWWQRQTTGGKIVMVVAVLWIIGASSSNEYWTIGILAAALMVYWYCARRNS